MIRLCLVVLALSACTKSDPVVVADAAVDVDASEVHAVDASEDVTMADAATAATGTAP